MNDTHPIKNHINHKILPQNGYSIHYFISGPQEGETIVFLHPAFVDHRAFDKQIDYFAPKYRIITLDILGHGLSQPKKTKDKIEATGGHIDEILKLEGVEKAHFVGVSMGSLLAQYFALHHSTKVLSLTAVGGYDINADNQAIKIAQRNEMFKWLFKALFSMDSLRRYLASVSVFDLGEQENFFEISKSFTRKSFLVMRGLDAVVKPRSNVKRSYPLLILCGRNDSKISLNAAMSWHQSDPTSEYLVIISAGHCANMDKAEEFNMVLENFITSDNGSFTQHF